MQRKTVIRQDYLSMKEDVDDVIDNFKNHPKILGDAERNVIKIVSLNDRFYTIKSFKIPNLINQIAYRFVRKSKAERSYMYANKLLALKIKTPVPIAYKIETTFFLFKKSFYVSELVNCDLTYRDLTFDFDIPDYEEILRAFTRFTYLLHKNKVNFLDHSPGNTLIKRKKDGYDFYLVDLNRMKFEDMDFETRIKNFAKLTIHKSMVETMSNEYAKCTGEDEDDISNLMWKYTQEFQNRYYRKDRLKKRILFWRKR